ncbi:HAD family hydrolase [bacterium]|nr:HAD family hydrolase [bacterium]
MTAHDTSSSNRQHGHLAVFDLDGTLYRTAPVVVAAILGAADEHGHARPAEAEILEFIGRGIGDLVRAMFPLTGAEELEATRLTVRRLERAGIRSSATLFDGIPELLAGLRHDGIALAVCSNGSHEYINAVLDSTGIRGRFGLLESGYHDSSKSVAMARLRRDSGFDNIILVGDTPQDRQAAADNGLPFIAAMYGYGAANLADCELQAGEAQEIGPLLRNWQGSTGQAG